MDDVLIFNIYRKEMIVMKNIMIPDNKRRVTII